jgi:DNA-binding LacI/PurR family transcriptional regulator
MSRDEKVTGFLDAAEQAGLKKSARVFFCGPDAEFGDSMLGDLGREQGRAFAAMASRPSGLVAVNDLMALGLIAGCRDAGLATPRDVSVVGMDDVFFGSLVQPALTTVRFPLAEIARQVVERVVARQEGDTRAREFVFEPALVMRDSVAAVL